MINSLKTRVLIWFGAILALILVMFSLSFGFFLNQSINNTIEAKMHAIAKSALDDIRDGKLTDISLPKNIYLAALKGNETIYQTRGFPTKQIKKYLMSQKKFYLFENKDNDEAVDAVYISKTKKYTILVYQKEIDNKIENFEDTLLVLNPMLFLLLMFAASKLIDKILLPIKKITQTAQDTGVNNFSRTIEVPKENDEIKALVLSFNEMIKRLKKGVDDIDRFNTDVSHELRTPLTVIKGEIEVALRKPRTPHEYMQSLQTISFETDQIEHITEDLLLLTRYSPENIQDTFEVCHLDAIVLNAIQKYDIAVKEKNMELQIGSLEHITVQSNPLLLHTIFSNLIDNAVKYTPTGKKITVSLFRDKKIHFIVKDEGVGIAPEELSKITERFYRVDSSRNKAIQGFGLGLSLVKNSVELLGGEMDITSSVGVGTTVDVYFG